MTKTDLIALLSLKKSIPKAKAKMIIDTIFNSIIKALKNDDRVEIRGFGSFINRKYDTYQGRNPRNGDIINVPEKKLVSFKAGKEFKKVLNKKVIKI